MYALIEIKGKQYKAQKDALLKVDRFDIEDGEKIELDKVLMVSADKDVKIGSPYLKGVKVSAVAESQIKDKKVTVFKYKKRKNYRRKNGHRQQYTLLKVQDIIGA